MGKVVSSKIYLVPCEYQELIKRGAVYINGVPHIGFVVGDYPYDNDPLSPWSGYSDFIEWEFGMYIPVSPNGSIVEIPPEVWNFGWNYPVGMYTKNGELIPVDILIPVKKSA